MAAMRAVCPGCCLPLHGELVAGLCNSVFHRRCLPPASVECPGCQETHRSVGLDLFGASFGEAWELDGAVIEVDGEVVGIDDPEVRELFALEDEAEKLRQEVASARAELSKAEESEQRQSEKLHSAEKSAAKREAERQRLESDLAELEKRRADLCDQADQVRQRDAVLLYWEELENGATPESALVHLTSMVTMVAEPCRVLAEVARLRDHHRNRLATWQKEAASNKRREAKARVDLEDLQRSNAALRRRLELRSGRAAGRTAAALKAASRDARGSDVAAAPTPLRTPSQTPSQTTAGQTPSEATSSAQTPLAQMPSTPLAQTPLVRTPATPTPTEQTLSPPTPVPDAPPPLPPPLSPPPPEAEDCLAAEEVPATSSARGAEEVADPKLAEASTPSFPDVRDPIDAIPPPEPPGETQLETQVATPAAVEVAATQAETQAAELAATQVDLEAATQMDVQTVIELDMEADMQVQAVRTLEHEGSPAAKRLRR